jgi:AhpD family alkylhydroperoxidase
MEARMTNPSAVLDLVPPVQALYRAMYGSGVDPLLLELVHLRASQINGCSPCVFAGIESAKKHGETDERLHQVVAWRESALFSDAERSALALTEAATRLADRPDAVTDAIWDAAADRFSEAELSAVVVMIATTNFFNRINTTIREQAGATWG